MAQSPLIAAEMCSLLTRAAGEDPIGSASSFDQLLVLEAPLPWPRQVPEARRFPAAVRAALAAATAAGISHKALFVVPNPAYSPPGLTRLLHLRRPVGRLRGYVKTDYLVPMPRMGDLVSALLTTPEGLPEFVPMSTDSSAIRDLLVCTHGSRDRCCGSFGYPLYNRIRRELQAEPNLAMRVWRVGHIGGHRFAPTLVDLPDGRFWAHLDREAAITQLLYRVPSPPTLARHYRGWSALGSLPEMVAERELFNRYGWEWTTWQIASEVLAPADAAEETTVRLSYQSPTTGAGYADLTVAPSGVVTRNPSSCGDTKLKEHRQFHVTRIVEHAIGTRDAAAATIG